MSFDQFYKKIKDLLEKRQPRFEEDSWHKMEVLLDTHLPVKKDSRRRFIILFIFFLVLGTGGFLVIRNLNSDQEAVSVLKSDHPKSENPSTPMSNDQGINSQAENTQPGEHVVADALMNSANPVIQKKDQRPGTSPIQKSTEAETQQPGQDILTEEHASNDKPVMNETSDKKPEVTEDVTDLNPMPQKETANAETLTTPENNSEPAESKKENKRPVEKSSFLSDLAVTLSAGPDLSFIGSGNPGSAKILYGAGLRISISKQFAVRTGYYKVSKIYNAAPDDYNPPPAFWNYYPDLKEVNADCLVTEIPVLLDYYVRQSGNQSFIVSAGLSSFIMNKETYNYWYKPAGSPQYISYKRTHRNENKHYFAVLNLSAGYIRTINKTLSLQAEPYFKIALSGVGYGKVNLNSTGVLISAIVKPFARSKVQKINSMKN